jgi:group II intron reverse transcriptase/maturase
VPTPFAGAEGETTVSDKRELAVGPARSENPDMHGTSTRENREILGRPDGEDDTSGGHGKAKATSRGRGPRKSDGPMVPTKRSNKAGRAKARTYERPYTGTKAETPETAKGSPKGTKSRASLAAETVEGRGLTEGNTGQQNALRTLSRAGAPSALDRVRDRARKDRTTRFTSLCHLLTPETLKEAYERLNPKASAGVDGVTWKEYGVKLEQNIRELHARLVRGAYRAKPSLRAVIAKEDGRPRLLGVAALEDKVVQSAVVEVLNAIYEEDFRGFSYGFRPGRSAHDALNALAVGLGRSKVNWLLDADIRGFFDAIDHGWLMKSLQLRIGDRRLLRLIAKWLSAGVIENGSYKSTSLGTPQGATISPLLANVFLHYVLDLWISRWRKEAGGDVIVVRYADDFIVGFEKRAELRQRLARFGLELHPDKTRLIEFGRFAARNRRQRGLAHPETFDFLGFTHICQEHPRSPTLFVLRRHTMRKRMRAKLREIKESLQRRLHHSIPEQGKWLASVLRGYYAYHAVPTNIHNLIGFQREVTRLWCKALRRRSQKDRTTWTRAVRLSRTWLPSPKTSHPWPDKAFRVITRGRSPVR